MEDGLDEGGVGEEGSSAIHPKIVRNGGPNYKDGSTNKSNQTPTANGGTNPNTNPNAISHPLIPTSSSSQTYTDPFSSGRDYAALDMLPANWNETDLGLDVTDLSPFDDPEEDPFDEGFEMARGETPKGRGRMGVGSSKKRSSSLSLTNNPLLSQARNILRSSFPAVLDGEGHLPLSPHTNSTFDGREGEEVEESGEGARQAYPPTNVSSRVESTLKRWEREEMERRAAARKTKAKVKANKTKLVLHQNRATLALPPPTTDEEKWTRRAHWFRDLVCCCCDIGEDDPHLDPELQYGEREDDGREEDPEIDEYSSIRNGKMRMRQEEVYDSVVGHPKKPPNAPEEEPSPRTKLNSVDISRPDLGNPASTALHGKRWNWRKGTRGQTAKTNPFE